MRLSLLALACVAVIAGLWSLAVDIVAPSAETLSTMTRTQTGRIGTAARLGLVRGDLWAAEALLAGAVDPDALFSTARVQHDNATAIGAARNALALAPMRSDIWLLLSALDPVPQAEHRDDALQMAYLVGGGKPEELAARLARAARSPALADDSLQQFIKTDIAIALRKRAAAAAVIAAYKGAPAANRLVFIAMVGETDPAVAAQIAAAP